MEHLNTNERDCTTTASSRTSLRAIVLVIGIPLLSWVAAGWVVLLAIGDFLAGLTSTGMEIAWMIVFLWFLTGAPVIFIAEVLPAAVGVPFWLLAESVRIVESGRFRWLKATVACFGLSTLPVWLPVVLASLFFIAIGALVGFLALPPMLGHFCIQALFWDMPLAQQGILYGILAVGVMSLYIITPPLLGHLEDRLCWPTKNDVSRSGYRIAAWSAVPAFVIMVAVLAILAPAIFGIGVEDITIYEIWITSLLGLGIALGAIPYSVGVATSVASLVVWVRRRLPCPNASMQPTGE